MVTLLSATRKEGRKEGRTRAEWTSQRLGRNFISELICFDGDFGHFERGFNAF
jgi:hypothetical protein